MRFGILLTTLRPLAVHEKIGKWNEKTMEKLMFEKWNLAGTFHLEDNTLLKKCPSYSQISGPYFLSFSGPRDYSVFSPYAGKYRPEKL